MACPACTFESIRCDGDDRNSAHGEPFGSDLNVVSFIRLIEEAPAKELKTGQPVTSAALGCFFSESVSLGCGNVVLEFSGAKIPSGEFVIDSLLGFSGEATFLLQMEQLLIGERLVETIEFGGIGHSAKGEGLDEV